MPVNAYNNATESFEDVWPANERCDRHEKLSLAGFSNAPWPRSC